jgi:hypothetical protein
MLEKTVAENIGVNQVRVSIWVWQKTMGRAIKVGIAQK